ncbi:hypothetical protein J1N35_028779 [Gossypium stocksii]|uniref:Uncharacterized protein n=1 Tax=Gossypium stocksii TaxID=47602 RepID=A0A9D3UWZ0_9ROSI|nr:hypothetical protein J1N35_028779 [Gossypium stocksii]
MSRANSYFKLARASMANLGDQKKLFKDFIAGRFNYSPLLKKFLPSASNTPLKHTPLRNKYISTLMEQCN